MRVFRHSPWRWWFGVASLAATARAWGQDPALLEPRWLRVNFNQASVGVETEVLRENYSVNGANPSVHKYWIATPLLGLRLDGSVYHPNLATFHFDGEGGAGWGQDSVTGPGSVTARNESQNLVRYIASIDFLSGKPYNAGAFATQDHNYSNYDFFNTAVVDSLRYGGRAAWNVKSFNLSLDAGNRQQEASGLTGTSFIADTYLNFNGLSQRDRGSSTLAYTYDDYRNRVNAEPTQQGVSQSFSASDSQTFGRNGQISASGGVGYGQADYSTSKLQTFNANANVIAQHSATLESFYNFNYVDNEQSPASSSLIQAMAGLRHQLYASLSSAVDVHGSFNNFSGSLSDGHNNLYGVALNERYSKNLTPWARLSLGGAVSLDHQDNQASGSVLTVLNESHVISDIVPATLKYPHVILSTIVVTGPGGAPTYKQGTDYQVIQSGEMTQLLRNPTSLDLPNDSQILVNYNSDSLYTATFESYTSGVQIRLDLFNTVGLYGRYNSLGNNAPPSVSVESLTDWVGGAEVSLSWLRAGAEYQDYNSNFSQYHATRLFQTFTFRPADDLTLGLDLNQIWYRYPTNPQEVQYRFMARADTQLNGWLAWNVEGGYYLREAMNVQQDLAAARTGLVMTWGKLIIRTGYQYNYELTQQSGLLTRNFFYLHLRRVF
jgi:hypothetical protein